VNVSGGAWGLEVAVSELNEIRCRLDALADEKKERKCRRT
jgi:hypothetical protein